MPMCPHKRFYDIENECPDCYQSEQDRLINQEIAFESLEIAQKNLEASKQILAAHQRANLSISSIPSGADIELGGAFVGNTPSTIAVGSGTHAVTISKDGYFPWQRKVLVSAGSVSITAELAIASPEQVAQEKQRQEREQIQLKEKQRRENEQAERARERAEREKKQQRAREQVKQTDPEFLELRRWANEQVEWAKKTRQALDQRESQNPELGVSPMETIRQGDGSVANQRSEDYQRPRRFGLTVLLFLAGIITAIIALFLLAPKH